MSEGSALLVLPLLFILNDCQIDSFTKTNSNSNSNPGNFERQYYVGKPNPQTRLYHLDWEVF